jgi:hypothetical protein
MVSSSNSIDQLKGLVSQRRGIARGNVYRVFFPAIPGASSQEVNLLCTSVNIPGRQIMTQEKKIGLINQKIAYDHAYDDVQLSFLLLNDYGIRTYFERWQNLAINQSTLEVGYLRDYAFDIRIQQLTKGFDLPVYQTPIDIPTIPSLIQRALPKIGPINLAQGSLEVSFLNANQIVYECTLIDAFPTTMNTIELGNAQEENVMELGVQLSYKNWVSTANPIYKTQSFLQAQGENLISRLF